MFKLKVKIQSQENNEFSTGFQLMGLGLTPLCHYIKVLFAKILSFQGFILKNHQAFTNYFIKSARLITGQAVGFVKSTFQ
ncbi:hypothetical protein CICLE_v10003022mg [Citrus x clementina]|uniref:Uncharacterized protein n=1 Tax=Citrus clementina TaxID=85681 RepID=V4TCV0_CITCL|nr:hypothetical protein CICLE_v10003022mg [Citrus x clementina]